MPEHVRIVARTRDWLRYEVPDRYIRRDARGHYKGQKQIWYLLQLIGPGLEPEPARHQPSRVRRLALERLLGAAGRGGRIQARRLRDGADRTGALPAAARPPQPLPAQRHALARPRRRTTAHASRCPAPAFELPPGATFEPDPQAGAATHAPKRQACSVRRAGRWRWRCAGRQPAPSRSSCPTDPDWKEVEAPPPPAAAHRAA